jgi:hypothetical protein
MGMSDYTDEFFPGNQSDQSAGGHPQPEDPLTTLSWALLDEQITQDEIDLLDTLLLSDDAARAAYLGCVQLHSDLLFHFQEQRQPATTAAATKSLVLGFLGDAAQPFSVQPPNAEDSRA